MIERDKLIICNVLNGCGVAVAAIAQGVTEDYADELMSRVKQAIAEYIATGRTTYFEFHTIQDLQANKLRAMEVIDALEMWDNAERPALLEIFSGASLPATLEKYGVEKARLDAVFDDVLVRISAYLTGDDLAQYFKDSATWIKRNQARTQEILERFTSWTAGQQLKNIEFKIQTADATQVN